MFEHLSKHSISVTDEVVEKLERLAQDRRAYLEQQARQRAKFEQFFEGVADTPGLTQKPAKGHKQNKALQRFTAEWMATLQLMRGLTKEFADLKMRPAWVDPDAHPAIHFDQFLHAFYYDYVRGGVDEEQEEHLSGLDKVEAFFSKHRESPAAALRKAAEWWQSLPSAGHGEEAFIRQVAPDMQKG